MPKKGLSCFPQKRNINYAAFSSHMRHETAQHLIYGSILLVITTGLFFYSYTGIQELRAQTAVLQQDLAQAAETISALTQATRNLEEELGIVNTQLEERASQISLLSKDLEQVKTESAAQIVELEENIKTLQAENEDFSGIIEEVIPGVVSIKTNVGTGSGFFVRSDGYMATNYHVILGATAGSVVTSDGTAHPIRIVGFNADADLAILDTTGEGYTKLEFGNSQNTKVGEKVIAVGNPGGLAFSVTQGIISSTERYDEQGNLLFQIDVPINPGNSGGPLIDKTGKVIGINTKKVKGYESLGFALAANPAQEIINEIIEQDLAAQIPAG